MKTLLFYLFFICSLGAVSQNKPEIKIPKDKLKDIKTIKDIIKVIPEECAVTQFVICFSINEQAKEFPSSEGTISPVAKAIIISLEKGQKFFVERIKSTCTRSHQPAYKIIVD